MSDRDQFHRAARDGYLDLLKEATRKDCNSPDEDGMTPTLYAAHCGNLEALRLLVGRGGDPDKCDHFGNTALHCSAANGHLGCVSFLVSFDCNLFAMDNDFHTAKEVAAINQKEEILRFLDGVIAKVSAEKPKLVEKLKDKSMKEAEKRIKNYSKLQKKATKKAEKDEKVLEKQRQKMVVTDSNSKRPLLDPNNIRKDSRLLYVSPKFSDIVNTTSSSNKKGLGAVSKKIQIKKQDSASSEFKVREMEGGGKKSVRSLSGLRRDSEIMYVPKYDETNSKRHMKDVFDSNSNISKAASEPGIGRAPNNSPLDLYKDGERLTIPEPSSIFERPGFGSVAFRNSITSTLLSLPSMSASDHDVDEDDEENEFDDPNDSIGSASSLQQRTQANLPWNEEDLNMEDDQDEGDDSSPLILFFAAHGLIDYIPLFTQEKIDLDALMLLNEEDLKELGLQLGPRKKLMKAIDARRNALHDPGVVRDVSI